MLHSKALSLLDSRTELNNAQLQALLWRAETPVKSKRKAREMAPLVKRLLRKHKEFC